MGINERLQKIEKEIEQKKSKKWRLHRKARVSKSKAKRNYVGILKINENGIIEPSRQQIEDQTTIIDGIPRLATPQYVLRWVQGRKNFPVIIQPSWSTVPFSPQKNQEDTLNNGGSISGYKLLLNRMKLTNVESKKHVSGMLKWIIGLGLAGIVIYALVTGGGV